MSLQDLQPKDSSLEELVRICLVRTSLTINALSDLRADVYRICDSRPDSAVQWRELLPLFDRMKERIEYDGESLPPLSSEQS